MCVCVVCVSCADDCVHDCARVLVEMLVCNGLYIIDCAHIFKRTCLSTNARVKYQCVNVIAQTFVNKCVCINIRAPMLMRKCVCVNVCAQIFIRICCFANVRAQMHVHKCLAANVHAQTFNRKCPCVNVRV